MAAVATSDFLMLRKAFEAVRRSALKPRAKLMKALAAVVEFSEKHPARYRLLFDDPAIAVQGGELEESALAAFTEFIVIVQECQTARSLPDLPSTALAALLFATMHGLFALQASGRMHPKKWLSGVQSSLKMLVQLLSPQES